VFAIVLAASALAYIPLALRVSPLDWTAAGPFAFQTTRVIHYAVYFVVGVALGAAGLERGLVARGGALAARWPAWVAGAALAFWLAIEAGKRSYLSGGAQGWLIANAASFVVACAAISFAFLACFVRVPWGRSPRLTSLRANAYAIYVVHYVYVSWLQYALLDAALPAAAKAGLVFTGALAFSWLAAAGLRRLGRAIAGTRITGVADHPVA
jgi:surface polysaccharide O-acyltransferase-like enzyme